MKRSILAIVAALAVVWSGSVVDGQCVGGQCVGGACNQPGQLWRPSVPRVADGIEVNGPDTAGPLKWTYAKPIGHLASVVRITGDSGRGERTMGSGVVVKYEKDLVVLTNYHVIADGGRFRVWTHDGRSHPAKWLARDKGWDVAVLDIGEPKGVQAAQIAWGEDVRQAAGAPLESCGYGPDGKLAVNSGRFIAYRGRRGTTKAEWIVLSGRARGGDSGGPIFDRRGRVVGVLWGQGGGEVVGVQAGRIHVVIRKGLEMRRRLGGRRRAMVPLPPSPPLPGIQKQRIQANRSKPTCLPRRRQQQPSIVVQPDPAVGHGLNTITGQLDQISRNTAPLPEPVEPPATFSPLFGGLAMLAGVILGVLLYFAGQKG